MLALSEALCVWTGEAQVWALGTTHEEAEGLRTEEGTEGVARPSRVGVLKPSVPGAKLWVAVACVRGHRGAARGQRNKRDWVGGTPTDLLRPGSGLVVLKAWLGELKGVEGRAGGCVPLV